MCYSGCCSVWCCVLWGIGWWLLASVLLMVTWNKVCAVIFDNIKQIKLWHALLVVLTLIVLFGPMCFSGMSNCGPSHCAPNSWQCSPDSCG